MSEADIKDQTESPLVDESNNGGSIGGVVLKKGPWTSAEDAILVDYVEKHGEGNWNAVQKHSGLFRCGKSCRLRWANHLRPNLKKGAFSEDEEQLIIQLHAKMGNKWARMAAHLPGRTDNEIKNYWNTRIKRRQRANLPLYPPEVSQQALQESQHNTGGINSVEIAHQVLFQNSPFVIPDIVLDNFKSDNVLSYTSQLPNFPTTMPLSFMTPIMNRRKRFRETIPSFPGYNHNYVTSHSFGLTFPFDPDPTTNIPVSPRGSHSFLNGNFSASKLTSSSAAMKLELPSLQYPEADVSSWPEKVDSFLQFPPPPTVAAQSDCVGSPKNSGLLDEIYKEANVLGSSKNHFSDKGSNSSTVTPSDVADSSNLNITEDEWSAYSDIISPQGTSITSIFSGCNHISAGGSSLDEHPPPSETFLGCDIKPEPIDQVCTSDGENKTSAELDISKPDAFLASDWHMMSEAVDAISTLLGEETPPSSSEGWVLGSCAWNNMPPVCQMAETRRNSFV